MIIMLTQHPARLQVSSPVSMLYSAPSAIRNSKKSLIIVQSTRESFKGIALIRRPKVSRLRTKIQSSDKENSEVEDQKDEADKKPVNTIDDWNVLETGQDGAHPVLQFLSGNVMFAGALGVAALLAWAFARSVRWNGRNQALRVQSRYPEGASMRSAYGYSPESSHGRYEENDLVRQGLERRMYHDQGILPREESYGDVRKSIPTEPGLEKEEDEDFGPHGSHVHPYSHTEVKLNEKFKPEAPDEGEKLGISGPVSRTGPQMNRGYNEEWEETYLSDDDIPRGMSIQEMKSRAELAGKVAVKAMAHAHNAAVSASIAAEATKQAQEAAQKSAHAAAKCQHALELRSYEQMQTAYQAAKEAEEAAQIQAQKSAIMATKSVMEESKTRKKAQTAEACQDFSRPHGIVNIVKSGYTDTRKKMGDILAAVKEGASMAVTATKHGGQVVFENVQSTLSLAKGMIQKSKGNA